VPGRPDASPHPERGDVAFYPDEIVHAGAEHLDPDFVDAFDAKQRYDPTADIQALVARGLGGASVVLDMGCGTGTFALAVAPLCSRVVAVDVSPPMLDRLAERAAERELDNIELVRAGLLSYVHQGAPADVVFTRNVLHQLPDFWKAVALSRLAGSMAAAGLLWLKDLAYAFEPSEADDVLRAWFAGASDDSATGYTAADLATHVRTEHSTFSWLLEPMLDHAGFRVIDTEIDPRRTYVRYACLKR
jgi:SAM-dependent methyltransferase